MSELLAERESRKAALKRVIQELHQGKTVEEVRSLFAEVIKDVAPTEISVIEQELINEGLPVEEVQRLCDVHAAVFKESLEKAPAPETVPGHPVHTFKEENRALERLMEQEITPLLAELRAASPPADAALASRLAGQLNRLWEVDKHYARKENLLFPYLEKHQITGPPKVMWGVDDEIRALLKQARSLATAYEPARREELIAKTEETLSRLKEMIFKEEKILFPMALETLTEEEWAGVAQGSAEIGYCLIEAPPAWHTRPAAPQTRLEPGEGQAHLKFATGSLTAEEVRLIFNHLPVDITFVDKDNVVKYFSATKDRIFARTPAIIGRRVENCHPPASVHVVQKLLEDFKSGRKDSEDFWIKYGDKYVLIRYFAVRDEGGNYVGTLEVTMDIKPIQAITGEKRIMD